MERKRNLIVASEFLCPLVLNRTVFGRCYYKANGEQEVISEFRDIGKVYLYTELAEVATCAPKNQNVLARRYKIGVSMVCVP